MPASFKWTEEKKEAIVASYKKGEGVIAIAKRFHVRHESVSGLLRERGISLRTHLKGTCDDTYFHTIDTEEKAYWLGFLTADGYISTDNRIGISLGIRDIEHLYKFKSALNGFQTLSQNGRICKFVICSPEMPADLASHGILPRTLFCARAARSEAAPKAGSSCQRCCRSPGLKATLTANRYTSVPMNNGVAALCRTS